MWTNTNFITLDDLYIAYRKVKVDMFYEQDHMTAADFCAFEKDLNGNLRILLKELNSSNSKWFLKEELIGGYSYIPKSLDAQLPDKTQRSKNSSGGLHFLSSNADEAWMNLSNECQKQNKKKPRANFRIIGKHSVAFHVISSLWILKVGCKYDDVLSDCVYGARLRKKHKRSFGEMEVNKCALGNFQAYAHRFRQWRQNGLTAIRTALQSNERVLAMTADLRSFYHESSADFLVEDEFLKYAGLQLNKDELKFTKQLSKALRVWASKTPDHQDDPLRGLPVGLSASRVIANALLFKFDRFVEEKLKPIYYGRYIDDIFLVLNNSKELSSAAKVWSYLIKTSKGLLFEKSEKDEARVFQLRLSYSKNSNLRFSAAKQKIFDLYGDSGLSLLDTIENTIKKNSSEWRLLPDLPPNANEVTQNFIYATEDSSDEADNLRKSDGVSVRRLQFAFQLRNLEAVQRDLKPQQWIGHRKQFYKVACEHILTVPHFFEYGSYLSRIVGLAAACEDWEDVVRVIRRLRSIFELIRNTTKCSVLKLELCQKQVMGSCYQAFLKALMLSNYSGIGFRKVLLEFESVGLKRLTVKKTQSLAKQIFLADLGRNSAREVFFLTKFDYNQLPKATITLSVLNELNLEKALAFLKKVKKTARGLLPGFVAFPTRALTLAELTTLDQSLLKEINSLCDLTESFRGYEISNRTPRSMGDITVPYKRDGDPLIALPCYQTENESWEASLNNAKDPDKTRYFRLNNLINEILKAKPNVSYLVLPELALPHRWFYSLASKLLRSRISLIAGLEYEHYKENKRRYVSNQIRAALLTDVLGFPMYLTYIQEKEKPAHREKKELYRKGLTLKAQRSASKEIIHHGEFAFGALICSELSNIDFRAKYRGKIDALFVPEWNKDTEQFSPLVEATAWDLHCFVVQANNRLYGDCRIRAPYYKPYNREVARIRGGEMDYFVIGRIKASRLRRFQANPNYERRAKKISILTDPSFKPLPDGFELHSARR